MVGVRMHEEMQDLINRLPVPSARLVELGLKAKRATIDEINKS
jgi:hypothetical protein